MQYTNRQQDVMIYPSNTAAPSVETLFIEGVRFDICEVVKDLRSEMAVTDKSRFFLVVEDITIVGIKYSEEYFKKTRSVRWDFFCKTKADCKDMVTTFEAKGEEIKRLTVKSETVKGERQRALIAKANDLRTQCIDMYGIYPL